MKGKAKISIAPAQEDDIIEYIKIINNWRDYPQKKTIKDALIRTYSTINRNHCNDLITQLLNSLKMFHRQINKANQQIIEQEWFKEAIKAKAHLTALLQQQSNPKFVDRKVQVKFQDIRVPTQLVQQKSLQYQLVFELLYKNFVMNMKEVIVLDTPKVVNFLDQVINHLFNEFNFDKQILNDSQAKTNQMFDRLARIGKQLRSNLCTASKEMMLQGEILPTDVARCNPKAFFEDHARFLRDRMKRNSISMTSSD